MKKNIYFLILILIILGPPGLYSADIKNVFELSDLRNPTRITAGEDRLYVVDGTSILIYDTKDFSLVKKFGRRGEGPGELTGDFSFLEIHRNRLLVYSQGRLSWFTTDGNFIKQKNDPSLGLNYKMVDDGFVGMKLLREDGRIFFGIFLFDADVKKVKEFYRYRHPFFGKRQKGKVNAVEVRFSSYQVFDKNIFVDKDDGCIWVYDFEGKEVKKICPELKRVPITGQHKKRWINFWKTGLKEEYEIYQKRLDFPSYFPLIRDFQVADGKLYVLTYREKDHNSEIQILDLQGKLLKRSWVPMEKVNPLLPHLFSLYFIKNNRLYILQDNDETETWELQVISIQ